MSAPIPPGPERRRRPRLPAPSVLQPDVPDPTDAAGGAATVSLSAR